MHLQVLVVCFFFYFEKVGRSYTNTLKKWEFAYCSASFEKNKKVCARFFRLSLINFTA